MSRYRVENSGSHRPAGFADACIAALELGFFHGSRTGLALAERVYNAISRLPRSLAVGNHLQRQIRVTWAVVGALSSWPETPMEPSTAGRQGSVSR